MTLVLIGKDLVLEVSTTKIEDKQVPGTKGLPKSFSSVFTKVANGKEQEWKCLIVFGYPKSHLLLPFFP